MRRAFWLLASIGLFTAACSTGSSPDEWATPSDATATNPAAADPTAADPTGPNVDDDSSFPDAGTSEDPAAQPGGPADPAPVAPLPPLAGRVRDAFGVEEIHRTKPGGEVWLGAGDLRSDPRFDAQNTIVPNGDGSWKMRSTKVRMSVRTSAGYDAGAIRTYARDALATQGYMQSPRDWKNVEMTGYFRVNASNDWADNIDLYARGGRHNDTAPCEGSAYKGQLFYDGRTRWSKETWHVSYDFWPYSGTTRTLRARWVGFKAVMRNVVVGGAPAVRLELWLDDDADGRDFEKVYEVVDAGDRFGDATHCGGSSAKMPITWGGPLAVYRWDSATDVDFKWLSVREIE